MLTDMESKKRIQNKILEIVQFLDSFCKENGIKYYLMGGSALGAMRHQGFIPWDDDFDVFMTCDEYEKFIKIFKEKNKDNRFFLQEENTEEWPLFLSRICLNGTTCVSEDFKYNIKQHHNIFVDIMCLYSSPNSKVARWFQFMAAQLLRVNALALANFKKQGIKKIALNISKLVVNRYSRPKIIKYVHRYEGKNTLYMGHFYGRARFKYAIFPRAVLGTPKLVQFENMKLPVFENVEEYLTFRFGRNWNQMPDQATMDQYPSHADFVDLENDYTVYLKNGNWELPDEK